MDRFLRIKRLIGNEQFEKLKTKKVTVIGLGAVGSYAVEALCRSGIGNLRLVDFDRIKKSNINRQLYALDSTLGKLKIDIACERIRDINPACRAEGLNLFVHEETMEEVLTNNPDAVIDAIDSVNPKTALLTAVYQRNIPIFSSMGAALRTDPSLIKTGDLFDTKFCPLARVIRSRLKKKGISRGISCVFSTEQMDFDYSELYEDIKEEEYQRGRKRRVLGSLPTITGIFGLLLANMVLKKLLNDPPK